MFIYFWERQRQNASGLGAEREGDTESEAGSRLQAVSTEPDPGLKPMNHKIMTWAKVEHWATQLPHDQSFKCSTLSCAVKSVSSSLSSF